MKAYQGRSNGLFWSSVINAIILALLFTVKTVFAQEKINNTEARIMFYNVENLYDPFNDSITEDDDFTFNGKQHWSYTKYRKKLFNISKVIIAVGGWSPPVLVGLAEIENQFVLNQMVNDSPLKNFHLKYIHKESPDSRGVDVALLYDPAHYKPISEEFINIRFPFDTAACTRDVLFSKGILLNTDTIHVFVNHWPSNYGGAATSAPRRRYVAELLKLKVDSILQKNPSAYIIIMGDMNEGPDGDNITELAGINDSLNLQVLMRNVNSSHGTLKFRGNWDIIDQWIISPSFLTKAAKIQLKTYGIFDPEFLLEDDKQFTGSKPFRTNSGPVYKGGYSDHLPIFIDLNIIPR